MSVTFSIRGQECNWDTGEGFLNVSNINARLLLNILNISCECEYDLYGEVRGRDLQEKCRIALNNLYKNGDPGTSTRIEKEEGKATVIWNGRPEGYTVERLRQLLNLATKAGDLGVIVWG